MSTYSDINASYGLPVATGQRIVLTDLDAVKEAVLNLLMTRPRERLFRPWLYSRLDALMFELMSTDIAIQIMIEIDNLLKQAEPRVKLLFSESSIQADYEENAYYITLRIEVFGLPGEHDVGLTLARSGD